jgi:hypothetical protein
MESPPKHWKAYFFLIIICGITIGVLSAILAFFLVESSTPRVGGRVGPGIWVKIMFAVFGAVFVLGYIELM